MLRIIISMLSAIQHRPTMKLKMIWKRPKPILLTAWVTVNMSSGTTPLEAAVSWISAPIMLRLAAAFLLRVVSVIASVSRVIFFREFSSFLYPECVFVLVCLTIYFERLHLSFFFILNKNFN